MTNQKKKKIQNNLNKIKFVNYTFWGSSNMHGLFEKSLSLQCSILISFLLSSICFESGKRHLIKLIIYIYIHMHACNTYVYPSIRFL